MKRLTLIIMASLLMLGLTQCKKEQTNTNANAEGEWVNITVKVDGGDRHIVYPGTGAVQYTDGDKIYVGNGGHYVGTLTYRSGAFSGEIQSPSTSDYLHFYFLGGKTPADKPTAGSTSSFEVNISDQSSKLPVLSYGHSTQKYTDGNATYGCTLENQCALVKFPLNCTGTGAGGTDLVVRVDGMHNTAKVDFATATAGITATDATGTLKLYSESNTVKWAILLPQAAVDHTNVHIGASSYLATNIPETDVNDYVTSDVAIQYNAAAVDPVFSVAANKTVHFAPGNLQYDLSTTEWSFMDPEWTIIEQANQNVGDSYADQDVVSLFTWGANGLSGVAPYSTDGSFWTGSTNLTLTGDKPSDWGAAANAANLGGHNDWRTLTYEEWVWLLGPSTNPNPGTNCRPNATDLRKVRQVEGTNGLVILPDGCTINIDSEWSVLASAGAVFLPAASFRNGTVVSYSVGDRGRYWSATPYNGSNAYRLEIYNNAVSYYHENRYFGYSVRLVR